MMLDLTLDDLEQMNMKVMVRGKGSDSIHGDKKARIPLLLHGLQVMI